MDGKKLTIFLALGFLSSFFIMLIGFVFSHTPLIEVAVVFSFFFSGAYVLRNYPQNILILFLGFIGFVIILHIIISLVSFPRCDSDISNIFCSCVGLKKDVSGYSECIGYRLNCFKSTDEKFVQISCEDVS